MLLQKTEYKYGVSTVPCSYMYIKSYTSIYKKYIRGKHLVPNAISFLRNNYDPLFIVSPVFDIPSN